MQLKRPWVSKKWRKGNLRLQVASNKEEMHNILKELNALLAAERKNVHDTFECVDMDSCLGWEPRMDYVCDRKHLEWKRRQLNISETEMKQYQALLDLCP